MAPDALEGKPDIFKHSFPSLTVQDAQVAFDRFRAGFHILAVGEGHEVLLRQALQDFRIAAPQGLAGGDEALLQLAVLAHDIDVAPSALGAQEGIFQVHTVFVEDSADLQSGSYVSIIYSSGSSENGIYLENPFLRTEGGISFVYVINGEGKLEKRTVTTGRSLWGSYTEILDGITAEDHLAFPYGKDVREGADAVIADISELYS